LRNDKDPRFFYIAGPDGSGKSTHLEALRDKLAAQGIEGEHLWLRSPKLLSKPLLLFCRLTGLTRYKKVDGIRTGTHDFYRSKLISWIYPWLQYLDMRIFIFLKVKRRFKRKSDNVFLDRYVIDTLADLMVDTQRFDLHRKTVGRLFLKLVPARERIVILDAEEEVMRQRKRDVAVDSNVAYKLKAFRVLAQDLGIALIDNNRDFPIVHQDICEFFQKAHAGN
jgi:thymidylate kinase